MMVRLGDVCAISASAKENPDEYVWLLNLDMVEQQTGRILQYVYVPKEEAVGSIIRFDTDNVLYSKLRPNLNKVVLPVKDGFATSELLPLRPDTTVLSKEYLATYLRSSIFVAWATSKATGAKMPRLASKELLNKAIPLPSLAEQKRIASVIGTIDNLIALHKRQLAKLDELVKARFVELFGDPIKNTQRRPVLPFFEVVTMQRGFDLPINDRDHEGKIPVFGSNGVLDYHNIAKIQGGGVITGRSGTIGKVYYTENDYWPLNTTLFSANTHGNNIVYLSYLLELYNLSRFAEGSGVPTLNRNVFHYKPIISIPLPEQERFAAFVQQIEKLRLTIRQRLDKMETLKRALMQEYFG